MHMNRAASLLAVALLFLLGVPATVAAQLGEGAPEGTTCEVNGVTIPCDDAGIYDAHDPNCAFLHYHGELNGQPDPDEYGCGHGEVYSVAPGAEGVTAETESDDDSSAWNTFLDWADALFQGLTGGFSPKTVNDSVDIVEESSESMAETKENAEEYFDAYEDAPDRDRYTLEDENPEENAPAPSVYRWFWSFFE